MSLIINRVPRNMCHEKRDDMDSVIIATTHSWNINQAKNLCKALPDFNISIISDKNELTFEKIKEINPKYIFFPHWSWIIPSDIYENFSCVVFHMTDLPFGRGGSPLQNLISRGITETKITAISVKEEVDSGDIYLKEPLSLLGGAEEIYIRAAEIVFAKMIPFIIKNNPITSPQSGKVVHFVRRTPDMSEISPDMTIDQIFDYIRMLDAEGYPKAFIKFGGLKLSFSRPKRTNRGIISDVEMEILNDKPEQ